MPRRVIPRACLDCHSTHTNQSRCTPHHRAAKPPPHPAYSDPTYRRTRKIRLADHRAVYGDWCPGYGVPAHPSTDLTLDHEVALSAGGTNHSSNLQAVLCRSCNTRKGGTNRGEGSMNSGQELRSKVTPPRTGGKTPARFGEG